MRGRGVSVGHVGAVAVGVGAVSGVGWWLYARHGGLVQPASVLTVALLLAMAGLVVSAAWPIRRYLRGSATKSLNPMRAARVVVLAQAAALTGAALVGWYAAQLAVLARDLDLTVNRDNLIPELLLGGSALVLCAAGLWAQHLCRVDKPKDEDRTKLG